MKKIILLAIFGLMASTSFAQMHSSSGSCSAYTDCLNGYGQIIGRISCQVYGSTYVYGAGSSYQACQWLVIPYTAVQCSGYQEVSSYYGGTTWAWSNFSYRCPGR